MFMVNQIEIYVTFILKHIFIFHTKNVHKIRSCFDVFSLCMFFFNFYIQRCGAPERPFRGVFFFLTQTQIYDKLPLDLWHPG